MTEGLWDVLGIAATRDAGAIRKAYAARLKAIKRDLDPQQFQALRDAYERALAQAAEPAGQEGRSAAPPPRSPYSANAWAHAEPRVVVMPEPSPPREAPVHMRDLRKEAADVPAEPPPRAERRRSTPPRAEEMRDDRHRIEEVVRAIEAELDKGDEDAACARFATGHDDLAHPLHGVSLAALAGFERAIAELVLRRRAAGQRIGTFAQEAGLRFHWGSRVLDVRAGIDPLADSLAGFAIAEEILRCARGEASHRSPVEASFAKDLTRPVDPLSFPRSIMKRKERDSRRQAFVDLRDMPEDPLSWLPSRTVAWWQAALEGPRLFAGPALLQLMLFYAVFAPLSAALAGQTIVWPLVLAGPLLLVAAGATYSLALRQDRPSLGWVRRLGGRFEAAREFLVRTRELPWVGSWRVDRYALYPVYGALFMTGFFETLKDQADIKSPAALLADAVEWLLIVLVVLFTMALYGLFWTGVRRVAALVPTVSDRTKGRIAVTVIVAIFLLLYAMKTAEKAQGDAVAAAKDLVEGLAILAVLIAAGWGFFRLFYRLAPARRRWAWAILVVVGLTIFQAMLILAGGGSGRIAMSEAGATMMGVSFLIVFVAGVAAAIAWLPKLSASVLVPWIDRLDAWFAGRLPRLHALGLGLRQLVQALAISAVFTFIASLQPTLTALDVAGTAVVTFVVALAYEAYRGRSRR